MSLLEEGGGLLLEDRRVRGWRGRRSSRRVYTAVNSLRATHANLPCRRAQTCLLRPPVLQRARVGSLIQIDHPSAHTSLVLEVRSVARRRSRTLKLSLSKEIAAKFGVKARQLVHARLVPRSSIDLDFVELIFGKPCVDSATIWDVRAAPRSECLYVFGYARIACEFPSQMSQ